MEHFERFKDINRTNYHKYVTDLIGIRVFFLYREDWIHFHNYITSVFENDPRLYVRDRIQDLTGIPGIIILQSGPRSTGVTGIPGYTMRT